MGLSFHDEESMVESVGSLRFASNNGNSVSRADSQERVDDIDITTTNNNRRGIVILAVKWAETSILSKSQ